MKIAIKNVGVSVASLLMLTGCGAIRAVPHISTYELVRNISENAANINEAQARATNAIIVKNTLRARDRWPTSYSTLSGVAAQPEIVFSAGAEFTPLGLGNPPNPFGGSNASVSQDNTASAGYNVNPFADKSGGENVYTPITPTVFKEYWEAGWPKDILIMLFVASIKIGDETYVNDIDEYRAGRTSEGRTYSNFLHAAAQLMGRKCDSFLSSNRIIAEAEKECGGEEEMRKFKIGQRKSRRSPSECPIIGKYPARELFAVSAGQKKTTLDQIKLFRELHGGELHIDINEHNQKEVLVYGCKSFDKDQKDAFIRELASEEQVACGDVDEDALLATPGSLASKLAIESFFKDRKRERRKCNGKNYGKHKSQRDKKIDLNIEFKLRSIDSMIYFLGEYMRQKDLIDDGRRPFDVLAAQDCPLGDTEGVDIFSVDNRSVLDWAAGKIYDNYAVKVTHGGEVFAAGRKLASLSKEEQCNVDRTGVVLAILSQLYIRSQSDEFLKAPETSIIRAQ